MDRAHLHNPVRRPALARRAGRQSLVWLLLLASPVHAEESISGGAEVGPTTPAAASAIAAPPPTARPTAVAPARGSLPAPPSDLRDPQAWVAYMKARHVSALPTEARLIHRHGLLTHQSGRPDDARAALRAAATLDPAFLDPHLTLAAWTLVQDPSEALLHYAAALDLIRRDFGLQLEMSANAIILLFMAGFLGLLSAALLVVIARRQELVHGWQETLARFASPTTASFWALLLLALPFLAGFGLTLPTLMALAWLWPHLRLRERGLAVALFLAVLATPMALRVVERLALPIHEGAGPFHGVASLENAPHRPERQARLAQLAADQPTNPFVQFGLGWTARRGGDLVTAERAYRAVLAQWPDDPRVLTDLGNVLAMRGNTDAALEHYARAAGQAGGSAAAHFNSAQIHTQRLDYARATEAIERASALDFEMVQHHQALTTEDGLLVLADQWLAPERFWKALWAAPLDPGSRGSLPVGLRDHIETTGWGFSVAALVLSALSLALGLRQHRQLPLRACSNCGRVTCRRCAERRREQALCPACSRLEAQAETPEFSRVLLLQARSRRRRRDHLVRTAFAAVIPGFGLVAHRRVITATLLLITSWALLRLATGASAPFASEPRLLLAAPGMPVVVLVAAVLAIEAVSLIGYFRLVAQEREREEHLLASQRGRLTQASARLSNAA